MIDMRHKPYFLPQISMPVDKVIEKLDEEGIDYDYIRVDNPKELEPLQGIVFSDGVGKAEVDDKNPIWLSNDDEVCDGHHRMVRAILDNTPVTAVKIKLNYKDACRLLNKIQDVYDYTEQQRMEEVVAQDAINANNEVNGGVSYNEFLSALEENNAGIQAEKPSKNDKVIIAYRKEPIREDSVIGNFFTINPIDGFSKYQIEFDNLLDTNELGIQFKDSQVPAEMLAKVWFPHVNFEKLGEQYNTEPINLKNKAVAQRAQSLGYDGIKYGDKLVQGLK
jgi:hypothetical protein